MFPMYIQGVKADKIKDISKFSFLFTQEELIAGCASTQAASEMLNSKLKQYITVDKFASNNVSMYNYSTGLNFRFGYWGRGYTDASASGWNQNALVLSGLPLPTKISLKLYYPSNIRVGTEGYGNLQIRVKTPDNKYCIAMYFLFTESYPNNDTYTRLTINNGQTKIIYGANLNNATSTIDGEWDFDHSLFDVDFQNRNDLDIGIFAGSYNYWSTGTGGSTTWCPIIQRFGMTF